MNDAFPEAQVRGYQQLIPAMTNHEKDRHVLAAAVQCGAHSVVTLNTKDFPKTSLSPYGIELLTPEEFLTHPYELDPALVRRKLRQQAEQRNRPIEFSNLLHILA